MFIENAITGKNLVKEFKGFKLDIKEVNVPKGFATALIGENGAGKTTLLNMMAGIRLDYDGEFEYMGMGTNVDNPEVRESIGYTDPNNYYMPEWTIKQVKDITKAIFSSFDETRFDAICDALDIPIKNVKHIKQLSDGNKMKLMLASVLARNTKTLILDEPASPLDPVMRDRLCEMIREYIKSGEGERSVFFSTHNIADMENVTDYAIIMAKGEILEQGFVEDLKEKYVIVKGESKDIKMAEQYLIDMHSSDYGFEGLALSSKIDCFAGMDIAVEVPTLSQICVGIMKTKSSLKNLM